MSIYNLIMIVVIINGQTLGE